MRYLGRLFVFSVVVLGLSGLVAATARAESATKNAKDFFAGKTITYIAATKPGGGYDTYARLIARHMEKHLPGTRILVKNVPGAGHIVGTNQLYIAPPDGLTIGTFNTGLIYAQLLGKAGVQFDLAKLGWIGKAASDARVLVVAKDSGVSSVADLQNAEKPVLFASSGVGTASHNETMFLAKALSLNVKVIPGFSGNEGQMAMLRGDIGGTLGSYSSLRPFVENGYGSFLFHVGGNPGLEGGLPAAVGFTVDEEGRATVAIIETLTSLARLTAGPPGIPADRLQVLREAYAKALSDPELLTMAQKIKIPIDPLGGEDVGARVRSALSPTKAIMVILSDAARQTAK